MALYLEIENGSFELFDGSQLLGSGDGAYRVNAAAVEACWPVEACEAAGLYRPEPADAVPEGKVVIGTTVERVGGVVKFVHTLADAPVYVPSTPHIFAMGRFSVGDWEIGAISATMGIAGATMMDTGVYWIDFLEAQPDDDYIAIASDRDKSVTVTERYPEFCVVECTDMAGNPADPAEFVIQLTRVI